MFIRPRILNHAVFVLLAVLASEAPLACSVSPDYLIPSIGERTVVASHVALSDGYAANGQLRVVRWLKGLGPREITLIDHSPCNTRPSETGRSTVFLRRGDTGTYELLSYGFFSGSTEATPEAIAEVYAVMDLGLEEYLRRKGAAIRVRGIFYIEAAGEWQAMLQLPGTGETIRRSVGEAIHASTAKVIHIDGSKVRVEMVTRPPAGLRSPIVVDLTLAKE